MKLFRNASYYNTITDTCSVCESALALVFNKKTLPRRSEDGFGSPAEIFGNVLVKRFRQSKVRPVDVQINVRTDVSKHEMKVYIDNM